MRFNRKFTLLRERYETGNLLLTGVAHHTSALVSFSTPPSLILLAKVNTMNDDCRIQ